MLRVERCTFTSSHVHAPERRKPYPFDQIEPRWQRVWDERADLSRAESRRARLRSRAAEVLRARHVPLPERRGAARRASGGLHGHGHPRRATRRCAASTCCTRWAGTRSACRPSSTPSRPASIPRVDDRAERRQLQRPAQALGFGYDWEREVDTTDPGYFRWTQWIFLQLYDSWFNPGRRSARSRSPTYTGDDPDSVRLAYVARSAGELVPGARHGAGQRGSHRRQERSRRLSRSSAGRCASGCCASPRTRSG